MIRLIVEDGHGAVDLLCHKQPDHLMRKRHVRKRNFVVGSFVERWRKTKGTSNEENDAPVAQLQLVVDEFSKGA